MPGRDGIRHRAGQRQRVGGHADADMGLVGQQAAQRAYDRRRIHAHRRIDHRARGESQ